jgi:hypothetical protein
MSWITPHQIMVILHKRVKMKPDAIRAAGGPVRERQSAMLRDPHYKVKDMSALISMLAELGLLPFSQFWVEPLEQLYKHEESNNVAAIERDFAALYAMSRIVIDANPASVESAARNGALFFAAKYLGAFGDAKQAKYAKAKVTALPESSRIYEILLNEMRDDDDPCSLLIKAIASANVLVNRWNAVSPAERASNEMREHIRRSGYLTWAAKQIRMFPLIDRYAFNSLAMASVFGRRRSYPILRRALEKAGTDWRTYSAYHDGDFADFQKYDAANPSKHAIAKPPATPKKKAPSPDGRRPIY